MSILSRLEKLEEATKPIINKELDKQKEVYEKAIFFKNQNYMMLKLFPEHEWNKLDYDEKSHIAFGDKNKNEHENIYLEVFDLIDEYFIWLEKHNHHNKDEQDKLWNEYKPEAYKKVKSRLKYTY